LPDDLRVLWINVFIPFYGDTKRSFRILNDHTHFILDVDGHGLGSPAVPHCSLYLGQRSIGLDPRLFKTAENERADRI